MKTAWLIIVLCSIGIAAAVGCQVYEGGQALPSGYTIDDDIQYHAPGPEFKLTREEAAMQQWDNQQVAEESVAPY